MSTDRDPDYDDREGRPHDRSTDRDPDYDDRENSPRARRPGNRSNRSLWLVLGGIGCVVVLGCGGLIAAGLIWGLQAFTTDLPAATAAAEEFLDLLQQNRIDDAYAATSAGFQARQDREQFAAFVKRFETFTKFTSRSLTGARFFQNNNKKQVIVKMTLHAPNNAMTCTLELVQEDGVWKVDKITVP
ncbi:MAG: hypothetical protein JWO38_5722 [Gemmataceae bacterium]|nr:hypothetical protein [Gemmataceae bacterium]